MYDGRQAEYCGEPFPVGGEARWRPTLRGPDDVPETVGPVRSLQVVAEGYAATRAGGRTYEPVPGERLLRAVGARPEWFGGTAEPDRAGRAHRRREAGVLAGLETPGGPAAARLGQ